MPGADSNSAILKGRGNIIQCKFTWHVLTRQKWPCVQTIRLAQVQKRALAT